MFGMFGNAEIQIPRHFRYHSYLETQTNKGREGETVVKARKRNAPIRRIIDQESRSACNE